MNISSRCRMVLTRAIRSALWGVVCSLSCVAMAQDLTEGPSASTEVAAEANEEGANPANDVRKDRSTNRKASAKKLSAKKPRAAKGNSTGTAANEESSAEPAAAVDVPAGPRGIRFGELQTQRIKVGIRIKAGGECKGITASVPIPLDWPEQEVRVIDETISASIRSVDYRTIEGGVKQMLLTIPKLPSGDEAEAILTFEVRRKVMLAPEQTDVYQIPKSPDREIKRYLGDSPYIESRNSRIRQLAKEITKDQPNAWAQVRAIYDYVRANVEYRESELKGAVDALRDKQGDCEAMTSLFIALARAAKVPARMVWVTDHSYPEFYLEDETGAGHWFPCQISGSEAFGEMPETRVILQKGDNYKVSETRERRRYVAVQLQANAVRGSSPKITEITEYVQ